MKKPTCMLTNCSAIYNAFHGKCCKCKVAHKTMQSSENGVKLTKWAQAYPMGMVRAYTGAVITALQQ
eukprot:9482110-Pyramimonas_sp.AAC.1